MSYSLPGTQHSPLTTYPLPLIERYRPFLPITDRTPIITLLEGSTPLLRADRLAAAIGLEADLYLKIEGSNPTGSFKDRGMTVAVSKAVEEGSGGVICASTGNTSASAAAYAARAGLPCVVLVPEDAIALGKLSQALMHGARVLALRGLFDQALPIVRALADRGLFTLVNSLNPYRLEGQKTAAFEICDTLNRPPDFHAIPIGNAGNITAYWMGFTQYRSSGHISGLPRLLGFQAEGAAPLVLGHPVERPVTVATAIRIGKPASGERALAAIRESDGCATTVTDEEILRAQSLLASIEGVFVEPASAASVAGLGRLSREGYFAGRERSVITATLTGHGLKDPDTVLAQLHRPQSVDATIEAVMEALEG